MDKWDLIHKLHRLIENQVVAELTCPDCAGPVRIIIGELDDPEFLCYTCDSTTAPGMHFYENIKLVLALENLES